jgi:hypothetical protein
MSAPPVASRRDGARFDRAIDSLESHNQRLERLRALFPSFKKIFLVVCLAGLSWYATYTGMLELIRANTGDVPFVHQIAIGFAVAMLMLMVLYILDALFSPISWWLRLLYILGYVSLTLISIGFSFGFFWKVLESRGEAPRSAEAATGQVQRTLEEGKARIAQLGSTLDTLTGVSREKEAEERERGGTCPNSPPGSGPRMRLREADAKDFAFSADFIKSRSGGIQTDLDALNSDLTKVLSRDPSTFDVASGTRNEFLRSVDRRLDLTLTRFEVFQHAVFDFLGDYYVAVPVNATRSEARYLANLFVGLEGKGIVDRVLLPPAFIVRRKLKLQGSAFADEKAPVAARPAPEPKGANGHKPVEA